jgi:hypothetical protein
MFRRYRPSSFFNKFLGLCLGTSTCSPTRIHVRRDQQKNAEYDERNNPKAVLKLPDIEKIKFYDNQPE